MKNEKQKVKKTKNIYDFLGTLIYKIRTMSFAKNLLLIYLIITIIGSLLLYAPLSQTGYTSWDPITKKLTEGNMSFLDSFFTAASAFSDTGLTTNTTSVVYNEFGQAIIAILILIGGIGFFALKVFIFNIIFNRPISFQTQKSLAAERGSVKIGVTTNLIKIVIIFLLTIILIFSVVLTLIFYYTDISTDSTLIKDSSFKLVTIKNSDLIYKNPYNNPLMSLKFGIFHTISALNNAGFDIVGSTSLQPYYYVLSVQIIFVVLFVIGGMGYPVLYDVYMFISNKKEDRKFRFSLFTKLSVITYFIISTLGLIFAYAIEYTNEASILESGQVLENKYGSKSYRLFAIFFNTMSTRNAGFSTINMHNLSDGTLLLYTILMFIGSAPSSTAGGIRTTTLAIIFLSFISIIRGKKNTYIFGYMIDNSTVKRAFVVFAISIFIVITGSLVSLSSLDIFGGKIQTYKNAINNSKSIILNKNYYSYTEVLFEVGSAFGTTGLSTGITSKLSIYSKIALIFIMFIGQLGVSSSILIWGNTRKRDSHQKRVSTAITIG